MLVDPLHGLKRSDEEILSLFRQNSVSHQIILSKVDRVLFKETKPSLGRKERNLQLLDDIVDELKPMVQPEKGDGPGALGEIVTCSAEKTVNGVKMGINNVRWAVLAATGLHEDKRKILPTSNRSEDTGTLPVSSNSYI